MKIFYLIFFANKFAVTKMLHVCDFYLIGEGRQSLPHMNIMNIYTLFIHFIPSSSPGCHIWLPSKSSASTCSVEQNACICVCVMQVFEFSLVQFGSKF